MKTSIKAIILATAASGVAVPTVSHAANFQYDGVELSYVSQAFSEAGFLTEFDLDGFELELNYSIKPNIVIGGGYATGKGNPKLIFDDGDRVTSDIERTGPYLLAFYHADYNDRLSYNVGLRYEKIDQKFSNPLANNETLKLYDFDDPSKFVTGGIRYQFNEQTEFQVNVEFDLDTETGEDELSYELGARYLVMADLDVSFNVVFEDGGRSLRASVKKYLDFSR